MDRGKKEIKGSTELSKLKTNRSKESNQDEEFLMVAIKHPIVKKGKSNVQKKEKRNSRNLELNDEDKFNFKKIASEMKGETRIRSINQTLAESMVKAKITKEKIFDKVLSDKGSDDLLKQEIYSNRKFHQIGKKQIGLGEIKEIRDA